ncbi:MAG TPA: non-canonical purine NTP pyrophosphatase [Candidatus Saccharimonadales bacterium]|nr:non-canonical purine NTP pyrophosphatase [Candidatus Saccharimonadales bacterium]
MADVTFITGNAKKAEFMAKYLDHPIDHQKLDLDELQSLNSREIVEHKVRQAYEKIGKPVLVEDISFTMDCLGGKLPGPFIKWFIETMGFEEICRLCDGTGQRGATTSVCFAYFDGERLEFFEGSLRGSIPDHPRGDDGFGFNGIFIPEGQDKTNAEMNEEETAKYSLRTSTVYPQIKKFLSEVDK